MSFQPVDLDVLKLLVATGISSYDAALNLGYTVADVRACWADHCGISVWSLMQYESVLTRLPFKSEVKGMRDEVHR